MTLLMVGLPVFPTSIHAQSIALDYRTPQAPQTPATCPSSETFRDYVRARLGADPFVDNADVHAEIVITSVGAGLVGTLALSNARSPIGAPRTLTAADGDCFALVRALAATLSIAMDSLRASENVVDVAEVDAPFVWPSETASPEISTPVNGENDGRHADKPQPFVEAAFEVTGARTPEVAFGPAASFGLAWPEFLFALRGRVGLMPAATRVNAIDSVHATFATGGVYACLRIAPLEFCATGDVGSLQANSTGASDAHYVAALVAYAGGEVRAFWQVDAQLALAISAGLEAALVRMNLQVEGATIWSAPPLAAAVRLELRFWPFS